MMSLPKSWRLPRRVASQAKLLEEEAGGEDVDAHRGQAVLLGSPGIGFGDGRLLLEADDPVVRVDLHHAELPGRLGQADRNAPMVRSALLSMWKSTSRP